MNPGRNIRRDIIFPLLARLPQSLGDHAAAALGIWSARERADACTAVNNGLRLANMPLSDVRTGEAYAESYLRMLAREVLDVYRMPQVDGGVLEQQVRIDGEFLLDEARAQGQGVILLLAHYSRLLWLALALAHRGHPMGMVTMRVDHENPDMDPALRRFFKRKIDCVRAHLGGPWLMVGDNMRPLIEGLKRGELWVVLMDAYIPGSQGAQRIFPFLGGSLTLPSNVERLATRTGARLLYGVTREAGNQFDCRVCDLGDDPHAALERAVHELERDVEAAPAQWWQWNILEYIWRADSVEVEGERIERRIQL